MLASMLMSTATAAHEIIGGMTRSRRRQTAGKPGDARARFVGGLAAAAAGYYTRKLIDYAWVRVTGKQPPDDPHDMQVTVAEAIGFAIIMGVGMEVARLLATRAAVKLLAASPAEPAD
jgi:Protein of unknown function (DUF4235)